MEKETLIIVTVLIAAVIIAGIAVAWAVTSLHWWHQSSIDHGPEHHHNHWENEDDSSLDESCEMTLSHCS